MGEACAERRPRLAGVGRLEDAALVVAGLDARVAPLPADALPRRGVQRVGIGRIHHQIDGARARTAIEHLRPRLAAVGRLEHAAHLVVRPLVAGRGDVHDVGIRRMDDDARDGLRVGQAHVLPGAAGIRGLVDTDARHRRAEDVRLAGADPDDVRI